MKKIIAALLIGIILGFGIGWKYANNFPRKWDSDTKFNHMVQRFNRRLDLTEEQGKKVAEILGEKRKKLDGLRAGMKPEFEKIRLETRQEINKLLSAEQKIKYDILEAEMQARREKFKRP